MIGFLEILVVMGVWAGGALVALLVGFALVEQYRELSERHEARRRPHPPLTLVDIDALDEAIAHELAAVPDLERARARRYGRPQERAARAALRPHTGHVTVSTINAPAPQTRPGARDTEKPRA